MFCCCHFLFSMLHLSFNNRQTDRNADCCINTVNEKVTNLVNFGPLTSEILRCICMGGDGREANMRTVLVKSHSLGGSIIASL